MRNRTVKCLIAAFAFGITAPALGQVGTGRITFELSYDGGATWQQVSGGIAGVGGQPMDVRIVADWSGFSAVGFAGAEFDIVIDRWFGDVQISNVTRIGPMNVTPQTLAVTTFGSLLKIDDVLDTSPPGAGTRGIRVGQTPQAINAQFTTARPAPLVSFRMQSFTGGYFRIYELFRPAPGGNATDRMMRVYTTTSGLVNLPLTQACLLDVYVGGGPGPDPCWFADINRDGVVDFFDYLDFVDAFSTHHPNADFNHDCAIDFFDYLDFVDLFSGC